MAARAESSEPTSGASGVEVLRDGRYAVTGMLGEGSQGQTLEAVDKQNGRLVAIKRFRIKGAASWKDVELAEREAHVLSRLEHPHLPRYIEHFEEGGALYLVMERVEGQSLNLLAKRGGLDQQAVVRLLNDVADILDYLHLRSPPIIHRDIKPSNIIRRPDGSFALVDFGSVRDCLKPEGGSTVVGTFGFMAPEQFQGRALPVSDIYGLGATALTLLTGHDPDQLPHQGLALDVERALSGQVDARLVFVLQSMLRPDPDARAGNLSALLAGQRLRMGSREREAPTEVRSTPTAAPREARSPRRQQREQARQARREWRQEWRRDWHDHPQWKSRRWEQRGRFTAHDAWLFKNAFTLPLLLLGIEIAKLATWALFSVALPVLFGVLSIFFGRGFRRAAVRVDYVGRQGQLALSRASRALRERSDSVAASRHSQRQSDRVRVEPQPEGTGETRQRVAEEDAEDRVEEGEAQRRSQARR